MKKSQINSNVCGAGPVRFYVSSVLDWGRVGLRFSFGIGPSAGILIPLFHYYYFTSIIKIFARGECESHKVLLWKNNNGTVPQALRAPLTWQSFSYDAGFVDGTFDVRVLCVDSLFAPFWHKEVALLVTCLGFSASRAADEVLFWCNRKRGRFRHIIFGDLVNDKCWIVYAHLSAASYTFLCRFGF